MHRATSAISVENPISSLVLVPWPATAHQDVVYIIDVQRCIELGIKFWQNATKAVLSEANIPPECISQVVDFKDNVLYINDFLNMIAPGDRKANLDIGPPVRRAAFYIKLQEGMENWPPADAEECDNAQHDRDWIKSYDKNFNDEQMCSKCHTLNFKGILACTSCHLAMKNRGDPNKWNEVKIEQRLEFANATLSKLVWKPNPPLRSYKKKYGELGKR